jgi:hypothetical protein
MDFPFKSYDKKLYLIEEWATSFHAGHMGKNFSFKISAINFCKTFCTHSFSSLGQDLIVKLQFIFLFGLLELEMAYLR